MKNIETSERKLDDIIFENRNKEYGAYFLRRNYPKYLTRATFLGVGACLLFVGGAWTYNRVNSKETPNKVTYGHTIDLKEVWNKEEDEVLKVTPPPPPEEKVIKPPKQVQFSIPEPKADELVKVETPPPSLEQLKDGLVSNINVEGQNVVDVFAAPPSPPNKEVTEYIKVEKTEEDKVFITVEQNPEFVGGQTEMYKFIADQIRYPAAAQRAGVAGRVIVKFVVEKNGSIGRIEVIKGIGFGCDEEAIRVIESMPKWNPGQQNGKNVRVWFTMPIFYRLE